MKKLQFLPLLLLSGAVAFGQEITRDNSFLKSVKGSPDAVYISPQTLVNFFGRTTSTYLSQASDLYFAKAYAMYDNADGRIFAGGTYEGGKTDAGLRWLFTLGVKANVKDGFSTLFNANGQASDMGISFKTTLFGKGHIRLDNKGNASGPNSQRLLYQKDRLENELLNQFNTGVKLYSSNQLATITSSAHTTAVDTYEKQAKEELTAEFARKEALFLIQNRFFANAHTWWVSIDAYVPLTTSSYKVSANYLPAGIAAKDFKPYELNIAYTNFWTTGVGEDGKGDWTKMFQLTAKASLLANNSVNASLIESFDFGKYLSQNTVADTLFMAKLKSQNIYVGDFQTFWTPRLSARAVWMPFQFAGISATLEQSFGKVSNLDWRLGLPVSLKNDKGESKINFEIVWKEVAHQHAVGLSIGLPIMEQPFKK